MGKTLNSALVYYLRTAYVPLQKVDESEMNVIAGANIRPVRVGCVLSRKVDRRRLFLLGLLQEDDGTVHQFRLKTAGGYLVLEPGSQGFDRNSIEGMKRELSEEGFRGAYAPQKQSFRPVAVYESPAKGVLQFFEGRLVNYPGMGVSGKALFRRRKDHKVSIQYCSLENIIEYAIRDKSIPFETSRAIAASYLFSPSSRMDMKKTVASKYSTKKGNLSLEKSVCEHIVDTAGLSDFLPEHLASCPVYFNRPLLDGLSQSEVDDTLRVVPSYQLFFMCGPFMRQIDIHLDKVRKLVGGSGRPYESNPLEVVGTFINRYFERLVHEEILRPYLIST